MPIPSSRTGEADHMAGKADETDYRMPRGTAGSVANAVGVLHPDHFVVLEQVDDIGLKALEALVDLLGNRLRPYRSHTTSHGNHPSRPPMGNCSPSL
ncbi:MAG: hypothetical protein WKF37_12385 [Bryobacteraceae bacterium]